ncbi:SDR family NAD(P)-dependent oxidoreductase [Dactylosporangium sp. AC04546]|uniref:SDR family NAD(P)-dependent oxidoreductase n=1 Tax=Dactylosporangium sp. AC04546 TaxID=2862460 RepID=UPI001EE0E0A7|nr:SDR family NAD(P)-dependent oxidoreductase [Dactylosporangium sp. AC04546]WVK87915.1 SDR family NAD(P)-dependent oxidoreductase [Dactylosporangium sp. AC04546]
MSSVLVTGSTDGIGAEIAAELARRGHHVVRHGRRRPDPRGVGDFVVGDLASLAATRAMAAALPAVDVVIHNAGWAPRGDERPVTADGIEETFQVNVVAPYLLTALAPPSARLVFVSSDAIARAKLDVDDLQLARSWTADAAYANSKLALTALAFALARRRPDLRCNAVHPGWIRTKMSDYSAPFGVARGAETPVWLATSFQPAAVATGTFFHDRREVRLNEQAYDPAVQEAVVRHCAVLTGIDV